MEEKLPIIFKECYKDEEDEKLYEVINNNNNDDSQSKEKKLLLGINAKDNLHMKM